MKIINNIKLSMFYPEFKRIGIDIALLEKAISDKNFSEAYKKEIADFIKHLKNYSYDEFTNGNLIKKKLDDETITHHLNAILKIYRGNTVIKYISFIKSHSLENYKLENVEALNDSNFDKLYELIGYDVFNDNVNEILQNGYSERLLQLITKYPEMTLKDIKVSLFEDKVWNIINSNYTVGETPILEMFNTNSRIEILIELINNDLLDGLKYTYENIPESNNFIIHQLGYRVKGTLALDQFNMDFINNIGQDVLKKLYFRNCFSDKNEYEKIFQIISCGNFELIQDIVNYDTYGFRFKSIKDEDANKKLLESNINSYNKNEVLLNKFFGIDRNDNHYIKLFLSSINKVELPDEFKGKYETLLNLLNQIYSATDEEIIEISRKLSADKRGEYKKIIYDFEKDGNEIIKQQFSKDLEEKNKEILNVATHNILTTQSGKNIDIYELSGQPFTMLVHAITDNRMSRNNGFVSQLIENPAMWNEIMSRNKHISTSLISDRYMMTYGTPNNENTIMFGFNKIPSQSIKFTDIADAGINRNADTNIDYNMRKRVFTARINTVATVDDLMEKTIESNIRTEPSSRMWNEIGLSRTNENTGKKLQPNYIVCMDYISESSKKAADYFNIPIYLIQRKKYKELPYILKNNEVLSETDNLEIGHMKR